MTPKVLTHEQDCRNLILFKCRLCKIQRTSYALSDFVPTIDLDEIYVQGTQTYAGLYNIISELTTACTIT